MAAGNPVIMVRDWRQTEAALQAARADGSSPVLVMPEGAAAYYGAGYLAALQERARQEFPDVAFTLVVDCGDAPGYALACLRAGVRTISMAEPNEKIADIARQMGAELVRRPT
jgi:fructose/tagatose bisphosphate aldolase